MKPAWRYLAVGVTAYLLILVAGFPASFVHEKLQSALPGLQLGNVDGSVFSGHASPAAFRGMDLGRVEWRFRPLALLMLRLEYRLTFTHPDNSGQVDVGVGPGGDVSGSDLQMEIRPDSLINRFSPMELQTRGSLSLLLDDFRVVDEQLREVSGTAAWRDASLESPMVMPLGQLGLSLQDRDDVLVGTVTEGGEIGLSGEITLQPAGRYSVDLVMKPGSGIDDAARNLLSTMLQPHPSGGFQLKTAGSFR